MHEQMSLVLWLEIIGKQECADILPYCYIFFNLIITYWMHFFFIFFFYVLLLHKMSPVAVSLFPFLEKNMHD